MVNPILLIAAALGVAFILPLIFRRSPGVSGFFFFLTLTGMAAASGYNFIRLFTGASSLEVFTAGFQPPWSIALRLGLEEAAVVGLITLAGLAGGAYLWYKLRQSVYAMILFLMVIMGAVGLVMTRDLFNIFIFLEIMSIAFYGLLAIDRRNCSLGAGFKYIMAGGLASALLLIGIIYIYRFTGTLWLDEMFGPASALTGKAALTALFLILAAVLIELKPFPANGWALDVYQAAHPGIAAMAASVTAGGVFFVLYKLLPLFPQGILVKAAWLGLATFFFSNLMGLRQKSVTRLLGYSSIAQMGLSAGALMIIAPDSKLMIPIVGALFVNHFLAKAGLFWLAGMVKNGQERSAWSILKQQPWLLFVFGLLLAALSGLPPFPGFWGKWQLLRLLAGQGNALWIVLILLGSLFEVIYLFRWFGKAVHGHEEGWKPWLTGQTVVVLTVIFLTGIGLYTGFTLDGFPGMTLVPLAAALILYGMNGMSGRLQGFVSLFIVFAMAVRIWPDLVGFQPLFVLIFLGGGGVVLFASLARKGLHTGFYGPMLLVILSLGGLVTSTDSLSFFVLWEWLTLGSYLLIVRARGGEKASLRFMAFSSAAAYLILAGFTLAAAQAGSVQLSQLRSLADPLWIYILLALGFLTKTGALGLHIWLPGAYAESENEATPLFSAVLSKVGVWALMMVVATFSVVTIRGVEVTTLIGWLGALTAFFGTLMGIYQEDVKKLLAYSSMGQLGYIILAVAMANHMGFVTALYLSVNHLLFKGILFIAVASIIARTGTRTMYEMGGLIKRMPLTFVTSLIAIIALSGVPPLTGFGGKWLLYTGLIEKGWYLQAGVAFFASTVAFLYCYRFLHAVFLGMPKPEHRDVKEAPLVSLIPQFAMVGGIMAFSMYPNLLLKPLIEWVGMFYPATVTLDGYTVISSLGYWNGNAVMMVTMGVFMIPLIWLLLRVKQMQKVKPFNIVFAAERPDRPETTHFAHHFFAHYQKALGFWSQPLVNRFWKGVGEGFETVGGALRQIYTGNGQTYVLHVVLWVVVVYWIVGI